MQRTNVVETKDLVGKEVNLFGWVNVRRDHGKIIFIDLRDRSGVIQVIFTPKTPNYERASELRSDFVLKIRGKVNNRPVNMINSEIPTGSVEIEPLEWEVINLARTSEIPINTDGYEIREENRMTYRYLDLRRGRMTKNIIMRHRVIKFIRDFLDNEGFIEIETPILTKSTPEGARDYVVPSRLYPSNFYALPQSPQQYKQLLMVAGMEKYFQIARCFRDEDTRGDRQPEFTQLDIEMSFVNREDVLNLIERLFIDLIKKIYPTKKISTLDKDGHFPRLKYNDLVKKYGNDKPDLRQDRNDPNELAFAFVVGFPMFEEKEDGSLGAVHHPFTLPAFDDGKDDPEDYNHKRENGINMRKLLSKRNRTELLTVKSFQYDFICNGYEVGGGSLRTYDPHVLKLVFWALGHSEEEIEDKFGHILKAFNYGVPPHGGIAPGLDRIMMILENEPNIREVIAFPKTGDARDLMMESPSELDKKQLKELHLKIEK